MNNLDKIENQLDKKIYKTLVELKIESVANIVQSLNQINQKNNLENYTFNISVHEKSIRRDYHYDAVDSFKSLYCYVESDNIDQIEFKDLMKEAFTFGMTYKPLEIEYIMSCYIQEEKYNANDFINKIVQSDLFDNLGKKSTKDIFNDIVEQLKTKGENVSSFSYVEPEVEVNDKTLADHARTTLQAIDTKEKLFAALTNVTPQTSTRKKI